MGVAGVNGGGTHTLTIPFSSVTGSQIQINTMGGNDSLTVDTSLGSFAGISVLYDGGGGSNSVSD